MNNIAKIEEKINTLKSKKTKNTAQEIDNLRIELRRLQESYKATAMSLEESNYSKLIFIDSTNSFKKLAGHSALFYVNDIAKRIGRRANLIVDTDRYSRSHDDIVALKLTNDLENSLTSISITKDKKQEYPGITVFSLPARYTKQDVEKLKSSEEKISQQISSLIIPKILMPELFNYLRELNAIIYQNTQNMPPFGRDTLGRNLIETSDRLVIRYCEIANGELNTEDGLLRILKGIKYIKYALKNIENLRLMRSKTLVDILELSIKIEDYVKREYKIKKAKTEQIIQNASKEEKR